jgi:hypothetical protein
MIRMDFMSVRFGMKKGRLSRFYKASGHHCKQAREGRPGGGTPPGHFAKGLRKT